MYKSCFELALSPHHFQSGCHLLWLCCQILLISPKYQSQCLVPVPNLSLSGILQDLCGSLSYLTLPHLLNCPSFLALQDRLPLLIVQSFPVFHLLKPLLLSHHVSQWNLVPNSSLCVILQDLPGSPSCLTLLHLLDCPPFLNLQDLLPLP